MAGRPVTVSGSQSALLYWVVIFAILTVASLGLFIFQLTKNKAAENRAVSAERRADEYGSPPQYYRAEADSRNSTVFAVMQSDLKDVAKAVTGNPDDVGASIIAKSDRLITDIATRKPDVVSPEADLLTALETVNDAHSQAISVAEDERNKKEEYEQKSAMLTTQLEQKERELDDLSQRFNTKFTQLEEQTQQTLDEKDEQLNDALSEINVLRQQLVKIEREGSNVVREKDVEIGRLENQVAMLQKQIQSLKPTPFSPDDILTKPDGRILRAVPGSDVVYINLGAEDDVKVGMSFEVYSQTRETSDRIRGKASLEVVTVMENTSECRVTRRVPAKPIIENDTVVNIAFERARKPKFVVRGDFDLNYDGVVDFDGLAQVTSLVQQWGGQVVDELDESVDFVVIGLAPNVPDLPMDATTDVVEAQAEDKALQLSRFRNLVDQAQKMYIPVITQNQFLFLTGYVPE